jgi:hypothetical protein
VTPSILISAKQRDLLYDRILIHLSGIDAVYLAVEEQDFATADRLSREYSDELRLVMDDLGWGGKHEGEIELTNSADVVRRVISRLRKNAEILEEQDEQLRTELQQREDRNRRVRETCDQILAKLDAAEATS